MTGISQDGPGDAVIRESPDEEFWMEEHATEAGAVRLGLVGELDVAGADRLHERLQALAQRGNPVILDLHRLQFIDSSGLGELVRAVTNARRDGRDLQIETALSPQVRQVIDLLELRHILWCSG